MEEWSWNADGMIKEHIEGAEDMNKEKRIEWIDLVRTVAILFVVLCHATEVIYNYNADEGGIVVHSIPSQLSAFTFFTIGRLGVPLFLMISGYLLLDREYDSNRCKQFWKNNWLSLLVCTEVWNVIYYIFSWIYYDKFSVKSLISVMLFVRKTDILYIDHMWYMYAIIGIYLLFPFIANSVRSLDINLLKLPIGVFVIYAYIPPVLNVIFYILGNDLIETQISLGFSGGVYGIYCIVGYLIKKEIFKSVKGFLLIIISGFSFLSIVGLQYWAHHRGYMYNVWYDCFLLLVCTVCLFELFARVKSVIFYKIVKKISYYSFGIYLIHNIVRIMVLPYIKTLNIKLPIKVILNWSIMFILSLLISILISHLPIIGKKLLYIKS